LTWEMATGDHPFYNNNRKTIVNNILKKKLVLPKWLPACTHSLLKGLLARDASKRLGSTGGAEEIKTHAFFKTLNFQALMERRIDAPLRSHAKVGNEFDVSAHSSRYTNASKELSPIASPDVLSTSKQALFQGFSWSNSIHDSHLSNFAPKLPEGFSVDDTRAGAAGGHGDDGEDDDDGVVAEVVSRTGSGQESIDGDIVEEDEEERTRGMSVALPIPVKTVSTSIPIRGF
jgi:hypothetical protein